MAKINQNNQNDSVIPNEILEEAEMQLIGGENSNIDKKTKQILEYSIAKQSAPAINAELTNIREQIDVINNAIDAISLSEAEIKKLTNGQSYGHNNCPNWSVLTNKMYMLNNGQLTVDLADIALKMFKK